MDFPREEQGYGIIVEGASWSPYASTDLFHDIQCGTTPYLEQRLHDFIDAHSDDYDSEEELVDDFVSNYENDQTYWNGFEGLLVDYLNERLFDGDDVFQYYDECIYVEPERIGAEEDGGLTQPGIAELIRIWIFPYLNQPLDIDWHRVTFA